MGSEDINAEERQIVKMTTLRERIKKLLTNGNKVLWSLQPEVISSGLLDKLSEQDIRLEELKFAVFSSEVAFNMEMTELVNVAKRSITWIDPLAVSTRRAIARAVEGVKRTSNTFLGHLEKEWAQSTTITMQKTYEALSGMIPQFQNYVTYCMHQEEFRSVLENAMFKKQSLLKASFSERMNVERVLLPLQRLQTLRLLLQEIRYELIPTTYSNENNSCKKALYKVTEFLDECYKHLAVLQGPVYTKKLNDALENNAYHYGLGIALKAENGNGNGNLITFHDKPHEFYIPPKISRHGSLLPRKKQDISTEKIRHSYEGFSSPEAHRSNASTIQDEYQQLNLPPIFKEACLEGNSEMDEKQINTSSVSQDSGIGCDSWAHILTPPQNFNKLNSYKIETSSNYKLSNQYFSNEVDENKLHIDECHNSDCVFCQNNINECFNYILIGEIEHSLKYNGEMKNENFKLESYNSDAQENKSQTNTVPALILQQLFIAPPKLISTVNKQQVHKQQLTAFSKISEEPPETKISNDAFFDGIKNIEKDVQSLERNNNTPKTENIKHKEDLIKFPESYEELRLPKNVNICLMPLKTLSNKICLAEITTKKLENNHCLEDNVIITSTKKDKLLALYLNNKLVVNETQNSVTSKSLIHENDEANKQNEEPEDHIYAEPMYYSCSSSLSSSLQNITCSESSTPTESDALSINSDSPNIYDVPAANTRLSIQGFKRSTLSLCHLSASLAEDCISRKTLLSACEDVPLYQIFTLQQEKCAYVDTEDGYIEPMPHIYEDIDTILAESSELDHSKEMNISRPIEQCQRLRWTETSEVINSRLTDKLDSTEIALQEAKFEIITSEVSYFKSLCILESIFMDSPLLADRAILSQKDYEALFSTVQKVKKCSQQLLAALTASFQEDLLLSNLCKVISKFVLSGALQVYVDYCKNHSHMEETLKRLRETNPTFTSILRRLEEDSACQMCSLQSFLTLPMQRVTRFPLLIKAILRYLPVGHSESHIWKLILFELNKIAESCNEAAGEVQVVNERLISLTLSQQSMGKKKSKHFWKKLKPRKCKI